MPNDPSSLQARLDAMVDKQPFSATREDCVYAVALDLLRQLDERDERIPVTREQLEQIAHEVYKADRFRDIDQVWCNLHWLTKFAAAIEEHHGIRAALKEAER